MRVYETKDIRNIAVCGSSGSGKTQLVESILYKLKTINRLGKVEEGNTVSDYDPIEKERGSSISSSVLTVENKGVKYNFIDTPGYADFYGSVTSALEVSEIVLLVINPHEEIDIVTRKIWKSAKEQKKPVILFVNFMDNSPREFGEIVENLKALSQNMAPVIVPVGKAENFKGVMNLLENTACIDGEKKEIPEELKKETSEYSESLMDSVATADDELMEKFLEEGSLSHEDIKKGLLEGLLKGEIIPVLSGSALKTAGIDEMMDFFKTYAPSPEEIQLEKRSISAGGNFTGLVFKVESQPHVGQISFVKVYSGALNTGDTIYNLKDKNKQRINQVSVKRGSDNINVDKINSGDICSLIKIENTEINDTLSTDLDSEEIQKINFPQAVVERGVYPKSKGDEEKVAGAFSSIIKEDPTMEFGYNKETKELVLKGVGALQLELLVKKVKNRYEAEIELTPPKIAYKETARRKVDGIRGKYKKQTGGRGQYGDAVIRLEPRERGKGFEFLDEIVGGRIPSTYIPSIEKGIKDAMEKGVIAGYPVVDISIAVVDGSHHDVDSSDMAFQVAGSMAFQKAMKEADTYILEPIMKTRIKVTKDYTGAVMGDLNSRRGRVLGMEPEGDLQIINAHVPKQQLTTYAEDLRSITSGAGEYTVEFDHYEETPMNVQQQLVTEYEREKEQGR